MNVYEKLLKVQSELKAPKNQYNKFGSFYYRSCEDIQEGVKPLLKEINAALVVGDELVLVGDRYYIKATAKFIDVESGEFIINTAFAREELDKKGMDSSQITGSASSYARKYALNGLFCIDDVKDADTQNSKEDTKNSGEKNPKADNNKRSSESDKITKKEVEVLTSLCKNKGIDIAKIFTVPVEQLTKQQYVMAIKQLESIKNR